MYYHYSQNNSGGTFDVDDNLDRAVIIEADSYEEANCRAQTLGIYFDGVSAGIDCECCGNRWSRQYDEHYATTQPQVYSTIVDDNTPNVKIHRKLPNA